MKSTRLLLTCAAVGAFGAVLLVALSPLTSALALASPPLYALVASIHMLAPFTAAAWFARPGAASLTALLAGLIAAPFSTLGPLIVIALVIPAAAFDLVLLAGKGTRRRTVLWYSAAMVAAAAIVAISLPIIDARVASPVLITLVVLARLIAYAVIAYVARVLARRLLQAGVRPPLNPRHGS